MKTSRRLVLLTLLTVAVSTLLFGQGKPPRFHVIAFYTAKNDQAHISFVHEANRWFLSIADQYHFAYDSTNNWKNLNSNFLAKYQVVIFLDTRPEKPEQRVAFETYMKNGGAWIGFHFAAFALNGSTYPQDWNWYHHDFLGSGEYKGNTWRPTPALLLTEDRRHPATKSLPKTFTASANEWYSWKNDLRKNPNIKILLSVDPSSFPLGTGPKPHEVWHNGDYPVAWTNIQYRMLYINMGHNDIDYENKGNKELSHTFANKIQNRLIIDGLQWLGNPRSRMAVKRQ
jgi:hypothetical protein